ncbi:MAG: hypothetical protein IJ302_06660, partial [Clostridia bacterium]|nr:hypothetical protein [Clostridia bacterium]
IVPTSGWGYAWGNGPVSDGILFEVPYRLYLHTGETRHLVAALPYFDRYLAYLEDCENENGDVTFGLDDWAPPDWNDKVTAPFINSVYRVKFLRIARDAAQFAGRDTASYEEKLEKQIAAHKAKYLNSDGTCVIEKQTAPAMMIYHDIYDDIAPLASQLARLVEEKNYHHDCGMVGLRHLYMALNKCGLQEYAFRIVTASGYPSYRNWAEDGMTSLYETWLMSDSHNHHMYSDFMSWMMKTIIGISIRTPAYESVTIDPQFFDALSFANGSIDTPHGTVSVNWKRTADGICLQTVIPEGVTAYFRDQTLTAGTHTIRL